MPHSCAIFKGADFDFVVPTSPDSVTLFSCEPQAAENSGGFQADRMGESKRL
jgi:hypothetical protein